MLTCPRKNFPPTCRETLPHARASLSAIEMCNTCEAEIDHFTQHDCCGKYNPRGQISGDGYSSLQALHNGIYLIMRAIKMHFPDLQGKIAHECAFRPVQSFSIPSHTHFLQRTVLRK